MERWYPETLLVADGGSVPTLRFIGNRFAKDRTFAYCEIGIYKAATAEAILGGFPNATVHLFDFEDTIAAARARLAPFGDRVTYHSNTHRHLDSYNWSLLKLIAASDHQPVFDYIYLDGAHTVAIDALAFFLGDRLLKTGGFFEFDDYRWRLRGSSLDPATVPVTGEQYTDEQIDTAQVEMIIQHLVRPDRRYRHLRGNRFFRKIA